MRHDKKKKENRNHMLSFKVGPQWRRLGQDGHGTSFCVFLILIVFKVGPQSGRLGKDGTFIGFSFILRIDNDGLHWGS